ncbi:MAG TPA: sugar ABC transporter ATP-binding protein [Clostridiales bacterium]|nr:sugar ABC transporter ATP-binding protein [Clostridiales bacterium]
MNENIILRMNNISKSFPGVKALQKVNFEVKQGEVHALLGENGAGKSTLLKILAGAYTKDEGEIYINGKIIENMDPKTAEELGISIIYQEFSCLPYLSVAENIFLGRQPRKSNGLIDWKKCYEDSKKLLDRVGLKVDPKTLVADLKVAEQQMVEITKALSKNAHIIVMDEPTAPLTQREIDNLFLVIKDLKKQGVSIIYVSHRLVEIKEICNRITVLRDGCYIGETEVASVTVQDMIRMMVGRNLTDMFPRSNAEIGGKMLEVDHLSTADKLKDISFHVRRGEILGIAGLVGAGRTELARAVFGADPISEGTIRMNGEVIKINSPSDAISYRMGLVPEDRKRQGLILRMNVKDNTTLASLKSFIRLGKLNLFEEEKISLTYMNKLKVVTPGIFEKVNNLSGGNQQKVVLSKWLCANCSLLIIDEPTRGIDVGAKVEIYELMNELVRGGLGIIMISSEMPELMGVCDRILVMHEGTITGELMRDKFSEETIMAFAAGQHPETEEDKNVRR